MCTYCAKWFPKDEMIPAYEEGHDYILFYCERCEPIVKADTRNMTWIKWGRKGEIK